MMKNISDANRYAIPQELLMNGEMLIRYVIPCE
jgi:hypothetical protein